MVATAKGSGKPAGTKRVSHGTLILTRYGSRPNDARTEQLSLDDSIGGDYCADKPVSQRPGPSRAMERANEGSILVNRKLGELRDNHQS